MQWLDQKVNKVLSRIFGPEDSQGNRVCWFHSQNLNEDRQGNPKGFPWEGRWWLHYKHRTVHHFSWHMPSKRLGISVGTDQEDGGLQFHLAFPPVSLWLTVPVPSSWLKTKPFRTFEFHFFEVRFFDGAVWWKFNEGGDWNSKTPKWKNGNWHPLDTLLGRQKYTTKEIEKKNVKIPMPEGSYTAVATKKEALRKRPRWFGKTETFVNLDIPDGIPHEGKGTAEYNCGEDGLFGISGDNYEHAIGRAVASVLESRRKYNGNRDAVYPTPEERHVRITELRAKNRSESPEASA